jgi:hypothetical protein
MFMRRTLVLMITLTAAATLLAGDDATNPHGLMTLAAKQAWITLQRDLEKLDAQYQRDRQARINKALVELETAKAKAAQAANADEIVRIDRAISRLGELSGPVRFTNDLASKINGSQWVGNELGSFEIMANGQVRRSWISGDAEWKQVKSDTIEVRFPTGDGPHWIITFDPTWKFCLSVHRRANGGFFPPTAWQRQ